LKASDVGDVMINGRLVVDSRRVMTLDADRVAADAGRFRLK
jgi:hypothetical protein